MAEHAATLPDGPLMSTYAAPTVEFVHGRGSELFDAEGRRYLDFLGGLAVTSLGHSHPQVADALGRQARKLLHVSNLFANEHNGPLWLPRSTGSWAGAAGSSSPTPAPRPTKLR